MEQAQGQWTVTMQFQTALRNRCTTSSSTKLLANPNDTRSALFLMNMNVSVV
jgi:hypothetical protein